MKQSPKRRASPYMAAVTRVTLTETALGWIAAAWVGERLATLVFGHRTPEEAVSALDLPPDAAVEPDVQQDAFTRRLQAYASGTPDDFTDVPVLLDDLTKFQQRVLQRCRRIPCGRTLTYQQLARQCGRPRAARAVGGVMARNRIPWVIPCHRVVGTNGSLGGYSAPGGLATKRRLLQLENAQWLSTANRT
jgi:methylated-DNA-[protein]-cysteine S-methyltransferase